MKFRRRQPMYLGPGQKGQEEDADSLNRRKTPKMVDSWGVEMEPGDWAIEHNGETVTIAPVEEPEGP